MHLRILTWNLHAGIGSDGRLDVARIAAEITALDPDLVALQEVDAYRPRTGFVAQWRVYGQLTGLNAFFGPNVLAYGQGEGPPGHPGRWIEQYGNAVLTKWAARAVENHPLTDSSHGDGDQEPRGCLEVEAGPATWLCTHWGLHPETRRGQSRDVCALAAARAPRPVAILGDLNAASISAEVSPLRTRFLDTGAGAGPTFPAAQPERRIDYCFLPKGWRICTARVLETIASDHRPVLVEAET